MSYVPNFIIRTIHTRAYTMVISGHTKAFWFVHVLCMKCLYALYIEYIVCLSVCLFSWLFWNVPFSLSLFHVTEIVAEIRLFQSAFIVLDIMLLCEECQKLKIIHIHYKSCHKQTNWKRHGCEKQIFRNIFFAIAVGRCCNAERNCY